MNCPTCGSATQAGSRFCLSCGARLDPRQPFVQEQPVPPAIEPIEVVCSSCSAQNASGAQFCRECGHAMAGARTLPANRESSAVETGAAVRRWPLLGGLAAGAVALLLLLAGLVVSRSSDDDAEQPPTVSEPEAAVSTSQQATTSTLRPPSTAVVTPTTATTTTTTTSTTTTLPPPTTASAVSEIPVEPAGLNSPGSPLVLADPLPSGEPSGVVEPSFAVAQQLADALALGDWASARLLDPGTSSLSDEAFVDGYGGLDRASLLLIDARPSGPGYELLVVSVAVELGGSQTSLYCLTWTADPSSGTVDQGGGSKLTTLAGNVSPEAVRDDPVALAETGRCVWT